MHRIREPLPAGRGMLVLLGLFPVIGLLVAGSVLGSAPLPFAVLWLTLFGGIPTLILVLVLRGRGVRGFAVSEQGVHDAADAEGDVLPWQDVVDLRWEPTGTEVNGRPMLALVAATRSRGQVRVTSRAGDAQRFVPTVEAALRAAGVVPPGLLGGSAAEQPGRSSWTGRPPPDAVLGDPFADLPPADPPTGPDEEPLPPPAWPDDDEPPPTWPSRD